MTPARPGPPASPHPAAPSRRARPRLYPMPHWGLTYIPNVTCRAPSAPHSGLARRNSELVSRVRRLTTTRVDAVDTAAAELRRMERDLHDGAQARLVALGISLRATERLIGTDPDAAVALVADSRDNSARALAELRALVRRINPPVLAERGLGDALRALALTRPVPTTADIDLPGRLPAPVEAAAYFAVAEALANAAKHADAAASTSGPPMRRGAADRAHRRRPAALTRRAAPRCAARTQAGTFDGVLAISSPPRAHHRLIEVPCALSSLKPVPAARTHREPAQEHGFDVAEAVCNWPSLLRGTGPASGRRSDRRRPAPPVVTRRPARRARPAPGPGAPLLIQSTHVERPSARQLLADRAAGSARCSRTGCSHCVPRPAGEPGAGIRG